MKKIVSLLVAALLVLSACSFALAEEKTTIVIGATPSPHEEVLELINPRIIAWTGHQEEREGCLSLPGKWALTNRPKAVTVRALNRHGEEIEVRGEDLLCRALCHEIDHLDGKLFTDVAVGKVYRQ